MSTYRDAAVAGTFYPADPKTLSADIRRYLLGCEPATAAPKAEPAAAPRAEPAKAPAPAE